jgi:protein-L-isoaspartate(D-aspartate) O-methyltransferase
MAFFRALTPEVQRARMVRDQLEVRGIHDERVLAAMRAVPREGFVPPEQRAHAYEDGALAIGAEQTISQPFVVAFMAQALELGPEDRVLEVGAGSGYAAAVMARLVREVVALELVPELARRARATLAASQVDNVRVLDGDGTRTLAGEPPFEAISVAAAAERVPPALVAAIANGGRMVIPIGPRDAEQHLVRIRRGALGELVEERLLAVRFVPLIDADES